MLECVNTLAGTISREGAKVAKDGDGADSLATWKERSSVRKSEAQRGNATMVISAIVAIDKLAWIFKLCDNGPMNESCYR